MILSGVYKSMTAFFTTFLKHIKNLIKCAITTDQNTSFKRFSFCLLDCLISAVTNYINGIITIITNYNSALKFLKIGVSMMYISILESNMHAISSNKYLRPQDNLTLVECDGDQNYHLLKHSHYQLHHP